MRRRRDPRRWLLPFVAIPAAAAALGFTTTSAFTAGNSVPTTYISQATSAIGPNNLKPAACAALNLTHLILGSTATGSGAGNDLVLGTSGNDTITETGGTNNCIVGGAGTDAVTGYKNGNTHLDICVIDAATNTGQKNCNSVTISP